MKVIILAAGLGKRMRELAISTPKPMLNVKNGKNLLEYKMDILPTECTEVILIVGYLGQVIRDYFGQKYNNKYRHMNIKYVEAEVMGTGYCVWKAQHLLNEGEKFIVMCGDDLYSKSDLEKCLSEHHDNKIDEVEHKPMFTALSFITNKPTSGGKIILDERDNILDIVEGSHDAGIMIATGLYVLTLEVFKVPLVKIPNREEYGLPQTVMQLKHKGIRVVKATNWYQVTSPDDLEIEMKDIEKLYI